MNPESVRTEKVMAEPDAVDLAAHLADIEIQPLEQRAAAFTQLHDQLREQLEDADAGQTGPA